jgi:hypothetical protein
MKLRWRPVRVSEKAQNTAIVIGFALVGVAFLVWGGLTLLDDQRFDATAGRAEGVVVDNVSHRQGEDWIAYHVISFHTAEERVITFEAPQNDVRLLGGSHIGSRVRVVYDPQNPQAARVDTALRRWGTPAALILCGLGFFAVAALVAHQVSQERNQATFELKL